MLYSARLGGFGSSWERLSSEVDRPPGVTTHTRTRTRSVRRGSRGLHLAFIGQRSVVNSVSLRLCRVLTVDVIKVYRILGSGFGLRRGRTRARRGTAAERSEETRRSAPSPAPRPSAQDGCPADEVLTHNSPTHSQHTRLVRNCRLPAGRLLLLRGATSRSCSTWTCCCCLLRVRLGLLALIHDIRTQNVLDASQYFV
jgi:hypothetical protein